MFEHSGHPRANYMASTSARAFGNQCGSSCSRGFLVLLLLLASTITIGTVSTTTANNTDLWYTYNFNLNLIKADQFNKHT
jgi:hypothetical protein